MQQIMTTIMTTKHTKQTRPHQTSSFRMPPEMRGRKHAPVCSGGALAEVHVPALTLDNLSALRNWVFRYACLAKHGHQMYSTSVHVHLCGSPHVQHVKVNFRTLKALGNFQMLYQIPTGSCSADGAQERRAGGACRWRGREVITLIAITI